MRYFVAISFSGANYSGWQRQRNAVSIQEEIERCLFILFKKETPIVGAGRTDAQVNSSYYIAHFDVENHNVIKDSERFLYKINAILPSDICIKSLFKVKDDAHARFDAILRTYQYYIHLCKDPFASAFSWYYKYPLDLSAMNDASQLLLGTKDFSCFEKLHSGTSNSICTLSHAHWDVAGDSDHIVFTISSNRFLRNMVRAIVGSILEIGRGKKDVEWISQLLESHDRCSAGQSVPGKALFLTDIQYPYEFITL